MRIIKFAATLAVLAVVLVLASPAVLAKGKTKTQSTTQQTLPTPIPSPSPIPQPLNSYEVFWPISAGKVAGEPLYFLKTLKENLREALIFSTHKKTDYNINLSEKRIVEAEKLLVVKKDYGNAKKTLDAAHSKREQAYNLLKKTEGQGRSVVDLKNRFVSSLENQRALLIYLQTQVPTEVQPTIEENLAKLNSLLASLE